jgi:hypothetical protein
MTKRKGPTPAKPWRPLRRAVNTGLDGDELFGNDRYTVGKHEVRSADPDYDGPPMHLLSIHSHTRSAVGAHDWRHFQRIKNELCGPEREAVEIYPAESRLVDTANEFWLWVLPEGERLPFGFNERRVISSIAEDVDDPAYRAELEAKGHDADVVLEQVRKRSRQRPIEKGAGT